MSSAAWPSREDRAGMLEPGLVDAKELARVRGSKVLPAAGRAGEVGTGLVTIAREMYGERGKRMLLCNTYSQLTVLYMYQVAAILCNN